MEGSRFGSCPKDLAYSFQCDEGQSIKLNKRLPRITQRDVLPSGRSNNLFHAPTDKPRVGRSRGGRRLEKICGHTRTVKNSTRSFGHEPKRLPSRRWEQERWIELGRPMLTV